GALGPPGALCRGAHDHALRRPLPTGRCGTSHRRLGADRMGCAREELLLPARLLAPVEHALHAGRGWCPGGGRAGATAGSARVLPAAQGHGGGARRQAMARSPARPVPARTHRDRAVTPPAAARYAAAGGGGAGNASRAPWTIAMLIAVSTS